MSPSPFTKSHPDTATTRYCPGCEDYLPFEAFTVRTTLKSRKYLRRWCAECARTKWPTPTPDQIRDAQLRRQFGITLIEMRAMRDAQGGLCKICGRPQKTDKNLAVDHSHETGLVRGLLCDRCNFGLGHFGDDPARLRMAATYLDGGE